LRFTQSKLFPRWLPAVVVVAIFSGVVTELHLDRQESAALVSKVAAPIDDAYIHFHYARRLAEGHFFAFHPAEGYSTGSTSPLYALLLAAFWLLGCTGKAMVLLTIHLGGVWLALTLLLLVRVGRQLGKPLAGKLAAALWGTMGFAWYCLFSGMETGLYLTLILAVLSLFIGWRGGRPSWKLVVLCSLLPLARPEGIFLLLAVLALAAQRILRRPRTTPLKDLLCWAPALLPACAYYLTNRALTNTFATAGLISKSLLNAPFLEPGQRLARFFNQLFESAQHFFAGQDPAYLGLALSSLGFTAIATLALGPRRDHAAYWLMGLWTLLLLCTASLHYIHIARWTRYYLPLFMMVILGTGLGLCWLARIFGRPWLPVGGLLVLIFFQAGTMERWLKTYENDLITMDNKQLAAARVAQHLPRGSRLLVCDAGAIAYFSGHRTWDIVGLTTPLPFNDFRQGVGSRFELYERLSPAERPTHVAAYDFCLWPGSYRAFSARINGLVIAPLSEAGAGSGHRPVVSPGQLEGLSLVDRLDVADLQSEHAHQYIYRPLGTAKQNVLRRYPALKAAARISDGGRLIKQEERFVFTARPGQELTLVGRYTVEREVRLKVEVAGRTFSLTLSPPTKAGWIEASLRIPRALVRQENEVLITLASQGSAYHAFHYFFLQRRK